MEPKKIFIVDDHAIVRRGLVEFLQEFEDIRILGQGNNIESVLEDIRQSRPDVLILDLVLGEGDTFEEMKKVIELHPLVRILIFSMYDDPQCVKKAFRYGVSGYLVKNEPVEMIKKAIDLVAQNRIYLKDTLKDAVLNDCLSVSSAGYTDIRYGLSGREVEIFDLIGNGYGVDEISERLRISKKTVYNHRDNIRLKLNMPNARELVKKAISWNVQQRKSFY